MSNKEVDLFEWLAEGYKKGFISDLYCQNHDMFHMEDAELYEALYEEEGDMDFCYPVVRVKTGIYKDLEKVEKSIQSNRIVETHGNVFVVDFSQALERIEPKPEE